MTTSIFSYNTKSKEDMLTSTTSSGGQCAAMSSSCYHFCLYHRPSSLVCRENVFKRYFGQF